MTKKVPCVGFSIQSRLTARAHMRRLGFTLRIIKSAGWGVVVPLNTAGEREIAQVCREMGIFCVGLFTGPHNAPDFQGTLSVEVDTYLTEERDAAAKMYDALGKAVTWDQIPYDRRNLFASMISLASLSSAVAIWPESTETVLAAAAARAHNRKTFFINRRHGWEKLIAYTLRHSSTHTKQYTRPKGAHVYRLKNETEG